MNELNEFGHALIAVAYFILSGASLYIRLPDRWETLGARIGGSAFFFGCGAHHIDFLSHSLTGDPINFAALHHTAATAAQVVGAPLFIVAASPYVPTLIRALRRPHA